MSNVDAVLSAAKQDLTFSDPFENFTCLLTARAINRLVGTDVKRIGTFCRCFLNPRLITSENTQKLTPLRTKKKLLYFKNKPLCLRNILLCTKNANVADFSENVASRISEAYDHHFFDNLRRFLPVLAKNSTFAKKKDGKYRLKGAKTLSSPTCLYCLYFFFMLDRTLSVPRALSPLSELCQMLYEFIKVVANLLRHIRERIIGCLPPQTLAP